MSICFDDSKNARENHLYLLALTGHYGAAICQGKRAQSLLSGCTDLPDSVSSHQGSICYYKKPGGFFFIISLLLLSS